MPDEGKHEPSVAERLASPFYADEVEWKIQSTTKDKKRALVVPYIKARALQQRLDDAVGIENWFDEYEEVGDGFNCALSIRINDEWVTKNDGAEHIVMTVYEDGAKKTIKSLKGTYSGAFKRVCTTWGVGRYLYDIPRRWVPINDKKQFTIPTLNPVFYPEGSTKSGMRPGYTAPEQPDQANPPPSEETPQEPEQEAKQEVKPEAPPEQEATPQRERVNADEAGINFAKQHNIPEGIGVPMAGRTLGEALNDEALGAGIITYLAGIQPNKKKQYFEVGDDEKLQKLQHAALVIYDNVLHPPVPA